MAAFASKRQQARNERALQDLIKNVPGNDRCADCAARNPGWASWSLGIFLCMRCAALHRKLGTHISKVKSLSMDKWDNEQVDNMKRMGNTESNRLFNPRNVQPNIPIDADEVDGALERFIRQKYEHKAFTTDSRPGTRQNTGSTSSVEDRPPPLPPKPGKRFGFGLRASSSTFPSSRNVTPPISPRLGGFAEESPPRVSKASRVFGSNVSGSGEGLESKLATLRDMGFPDDRRNTTVLKGLNGNLDKAVEALIRLGEGGSSTARSGAPAPPEKPSASGITIDRTRPAAATAQPTNPFDQLDNEPRNQQQALPPVPQLQTEQHTNTATSYSHPASPSNPYNPFLPQPQQSLYSQQSLEQSFKTMQLSQQAPPQQPQQPLFPNRTGGFDNQSQLPQQTNPFQHSFTPPPVPQIPPQYNAFFQQQPPQQQFSHPQTTQSTGAAGNPFLRSSRSQVFTPTNPFEQQQHQNATITQGYQNSQLFSVSQVQPANFFQNQAPSQQIPQQQPLQQESFQPAQYQNHHQPFNPKPLLQFQPSNPYQPQHQLQQQQVQLPSPFQHDKSSILALYNYPQLAPIRADPIPSQVASTDLPAPPQGLKQRSVTMPVTSPAAPTGPTPGSMNPFAPMQGQSHAQTASPAAGIPGNPGTPRHVSNESVDFAGLMGGRHSPDAFSGLSARFVR
ncbi:ArfGap-domain-containing protein [Mytilinidion resinicola]|uniref:ArfGap-domain-containing protein n=1 Tax=Mytilinidion resinicola TaxID=574789 RepID=A0A6A6YN46_9PEZI|nr:ArfGap-domain-containing protein [Mytilinidion resinicola]KAF2810161.1 ArfGap-domain-containing protein [Mytilinidion resinicola]